MWRSLKEKPFLRPVAALLTPFGALAVQALLWTHISPLLWIFFYPAVFFSSILDGLRGGLAATGLSAFLVWLCFFTPTTGLDLRFAAQATVFVAMGGLFSVFNGRLRNARAELERRVRERTETLNTALAAEQRLRLELRTVIDTAQIGLVLVDSGHRYRYTNRTYSEILGLPPGDLVGRRVAEMVPAAYDSQIRPRLDRALRGETVRYQLTLPSLTVGGPNRSFAVSYTPLTTGNDPLVVVAIAEVSAQKQSEVMAAQLASIVESSNDAIIGKDLDGIVTSWNPGAELVFGFSAAEMVGQSITQLIPEDRKNEEAMILQRIRQGESVPHFETKRLHSAGHVIDVSLMISPIRDEGGRLVGASKVARDISESKRIQAALHDSEARLRLAFEVAQVGTWERDLKTGRLIWSEAQERMMGFEPGTFPRTITAFRELVHPEDRPRLAEAQEKALQKSGQYSAELRFCLPNGRIRWGLVRGRVLCDRDGQPERMLGIDFDISERRQTEEALRVSDARYRSLVKHMPAGVFRKDAAGRFEYVSERYCEIEGLSPEHFLGLTARQVAANLATSGQKLAHDWKATLQQSQAGNDHHQSIMTTGQPIEVEEEWVSTSGERRFFKAVKTPVFSADGAVVGSQGMLFEITDRKLAEQRVVALNAVLDERVRERTRQLEDANHELEAFSYSVSHDLRAPLRAINGFSVAIQEDFGTLLPEEGRRYLQNIRAGAVRMGDLIDDLLTLSRLGRLPLERHPVNATTLVRESLAELGWPISDRQIDVRIGDLPLCEADPVLIRQVWINLLANALKYTLKQPQAVIEVGCLQQDGDEIFFVRDNGCGFDPQYTHKLFGVFQRLHRAEEFEGTGVGLAIAQRVVHRHGGRIWAAGEIGRGATFSFTLKTKTIP